MFDVIIIGSGASSVHAAIPLVESGASVLMIDVGNRDEHYASLIPSKPFAQLRSSDANQSRYFLGDHYEGISLSELKVGSQLTPPRAYITKDVEKLLPINSSSYFPLASLAEGGLAAGWGGACFCFDDDDLKGEAISAETLRPHYAKVAARIGITGVNDDIAPFAGRVPLLPAFALDTPAELLLARYSQKRSALHRAGFYLGQSRLAMTTIEMDDRKSNPNHDMDFWSNVGQSIYRPQWTLESLKKFPNFTYLREWHAHRFEQLERDKVRVHLASVQNCAHTEIHESKALIIGAGVHGTAQLTLHSMDAFGVRRPIVCNPYVYLAMINLNSIGKQLRDDRHSMAQLCAFYSNPSSGLDVVTGQYYSYRSLLNFKLLKEAPLPHREGIKIIRALAPLLGIVGVHFADWPHEQKTCWIEEDRSRQLHVDYALTKAEQACIRDGRKAMSQLFGSLGCMPFQVVSPAHGSSIHYAGTFPMREQGEDLTCTPEGKLRGTDSVYICDGSLFSHLPSKGLTFTLMANANRIGEHLAQEMLGK